MQIQRFSFESLKARTDGLSQVLLKAVNSPSLTYPEICKVDHQGLYIIFDDKEILYVGKTNRTGRVRMREVGSDFRSHTFNKKLLAIRFRDLGFVFEVLKKETKKQWIKEGIISIEDFKAHQKEVNLHIKRSLKFKFHEEQDEQKLICLEHFSIAIFNPVHND